MKSGIVLNSKGQITFIGGTFKKENINEYFKELKKSFYNKEV